MTDWNDMMIAEFRDGDGTTGQFGRGLILMHTLGAKTGDERLTPVLGFRNDEGWMVVASAAGSPKHPAWYHNLVAHPQFAVEAAAADGGIETVDTTAIEITDDAAYDAAWQTVTAIAPGFLEYPKTTEGRKIPIVQLQRS
jgi:deazaflavin-dependent oxidoreductase (nitroreductase family)